MTRTVGIIGTRGYPSYYGGFETLVRHLAPFLVDRGWDVVVYGREYVSESTADQHDSRVRTVITAGVETKSLSTLSYGMTSSIHAAATKIDVALVMNVANGFWLPLLKARHIPTVVNVDGIEWEREKWGKNARRVFRAGGHMTSRYATTLIYDSTELGIKWQKLSGREGTFIPYGGTPRTDGETPDGLGRRKYVLMVARFVPENTIEQFVAAAEALSERWEVVIVGSSGYGGDIEARVSRLANHNPNVRWLGHVADDAMLFALWENAGAYFHGHSVGGTNPALVQAMACGAPIVARDTAFNREVLGDTALYVQPESRAIADAIDGLITDVELQEQLSSAAADRAAAHYTWDAVCASYDRVLREHLDAPS